MATSSSNMGSSVSNALLNASAGVKNGVVTDKLINNGSTSLTGIQTSAALTLTIADTTSIIKLSSGTTCVLTPTNSWRGRILIVKNVNTGNCTGLSAITIATTKTAWCYYNGTTWEMYIYADYA